MMTTTASAIPVKKATATPTRDQIIAHHKEICQETEIAGEHAMQRLSMLENKEHELLNDEETNVLLNHLRKTLTVAATRYNRAETWLAASNTVDPDIHAKQTDRLADLLLGEKLPIHIFDGEYNIIPAGKKISKNRLGLMVDAWNRGTLDIIPSPIRSRVWRALTAE